ncbi:hypothetical protein HK099_003714 [Clydaea vesicula]|uniref:Uncharacterized protein n=1 Tax=Clydaea vesicula TaxID=447962 RepID=A0AAD5U300_9FUNG|nr:hypothetical protein HK099_003714 [Clydaea vesicula]
MSSWFDSLQKINDLVQQPSDNVKPSNGVSTMEEVDFLKQKLSECQHQLEIKDKSISSIESELNISKQKLEKAVHHLYNLTDENQRLSTLVNEQSIELENFKLGSETIDLQHEGVGQSPHMLQVAENKNLLVRLKDLEESSISIKSEAIQKLKVAEDKIMHLEESNSVLMKEIEILRAEQKDSSVNVDSWLQVDKESEMNESEKLRNSESLVVILENKISNLENLLNDLKIKAESDANLLSECHEKYTTVLEISQLKEELNVSNNNKVQLENTHNSLKNDFELKEKSNTLFQEKIVNLQAELSALQEELGGVTQLKQRSDNQILELTQQLQELSLNIAKMDAESENLNMKNDTENIIELKNQLEIKKEMIKENDEKYKLLFEALSKCKQENLELYKKLELLQEECNNSNKLIEVKDENSFFLQNEFDALNLKYNNESSKMESLLKENADYHKKVEELEEVVKNLNCKMLDYSKVLGELHLSEKANASLKTELSEAHFNIGKLADQKNSLIKSDEDIELIFVQLTETITSKLYDCINVLIDDSKRDLPENFSFSISLFDKTFMLDGIEDILKCCEEKFKEFRSREVEVDGVLFESRAAVEKMRNDYESLISELNNRKLEEEKQWLQLVDIEKEEKDVLRSQNEAMLEKLKELKNTVGPRLQAEMEHGALLGQEVESLKSLNCQLNEKLSATEKEYNGILRELHTLKDNHSTNVNVKLEEQSFLQEQLMKYKREVERLRLHLVEMEEHHTNESLKTDDFVHEYKFQMQKFKEKSEEFESLYEERGFEIEKLKEKAKELSELLEIKENLLIEANEECRMNSVSVENLQNVLRDLHANQQSELQLAAEALNSKLLMLENEVEDWKLKAITAKNEIIQLENSLPNAKLLQEELADKALIISKLKLEVSQSQAHLSDAMRRMRDGSESTIDKDNVGLGKKPANYFGVQPNSPISPTAITLDPVAQGGSFTDLWVNYLLKAATGGEQKNDDKIASPVRRISMDSNNTKNVV